MTIMIPREFLFTIMKGFMGKAATGTIRRLMNGRGRGLSRVLRSVEFSRVQDR